MIDPKRLPTAAQREAARERNRQYAQDVRAGRRPPVNITHEKILAMIRDGILMSDGERVWLPDWEYRH
jgi:hypothetical protein